jgi:hypothetical protein
LPYLHNPIFRFCRDNFFVLILFLEPAHRPYSCDYPYCFFFAIRNKLLGGMAFGLAFDSVCTAHGEASLCVVGYYFCAL